MISPLHAPTPLFVPHEKTIVLLLDNISTSTSIWFLLSNNHMNSIITHKFDFAQEEVLAYYISFMRSLSMKLTNDTILFFHNEHLPDFPLYAEVSRGACLPRLRTSRRTSCLACFPTAPVHDSYPCRHVVTRKSALPISRPVAPSTTHGRLTQYPLPHARAHAPASPGRSGSRAWLSYRVPVHPAAQAVKFFNHKESMVRVAVRTLTLSIFRAASGNELTTNYLIRHAVPPYFSNLVWVLGNLSIEMDTCLAASTVREKGKLSFHVDEHLDLFCYINDVVELNFVRLTRLLSEQLVDSLLIPLYVHRLRSSAENDDDAPSHVQAGADAPDRSIGLVIALFLTAHTFLVFDHEVRVKVLKPPDPSAVVLERMSSDVTDLARRSKSALPPL